MPTTPTPAGLTAQQKSSYEENGYLCPIRVFEPAETKRFLARYMEYAEQNRERLEKIAPRERYRIFSETHFVLPWAYGSAAGEPEKASRPAGPRPGHLRPL